jgi:biotin transporter BioY
MAVAFSAGLTGVIAYYKHSRWLAVLIVLILPVAAIALLGWPYDTDFRDTSLVSIVFWMVLTFVGGAIGTAAVVLRIVR